MSIINLCGMVLVCVMGYSACLMVIAQLGEAIREHKAERNPEQTLARSMYHAVLSDNRKAFMRVYSRYLQYTLSKM